MSVAHRTLECPVFSQLLPKKKSKSRAWEHFGLLANESGQIVSEDIAVCKLCRSPVSAKSGSTSNLFGHLRLHHPLQFSEVSNKSKVVTRRQCNILHFVLLLMSQLMNHNHIQTWLYLNPINLTLLTIIGIKDKSL
ncbi:t-complex protein 1 subunit delta [Trichonephila clavipes]|nr:t-complex protein 1 subunit delta [Trichonephila clavipes]